ncbi:MAG: hypothetical protein R3185_04620 [Candidatus Thermoplasmatota archaeon]|nr:hypothetical protein [Candidatus Thermoplasmatota archaeon]
MSEDEENIVTGEGYVDMNAETEAEDDAPVLEAEETEGADEDAIAWKQRKCLETCIAELRELNAPKDVLRQVNQAYGTLQRG